MVAPTATADDALTPRLVSAVEVVCFAGLLVLAAAAWVDRPGALLEVATIGVAGAALWLAIGQAAVGRSTAVLAGLSFAVCLTNTWPGRGWTLAIGHLPAGPDALLAPATVLFVLAALLDRRAPRHGRAPTSLRLAAGLIVAAVVVSTLIAAKAAPGGAALLEFLVPLAVGALVIRRSPGLEDSWVVVTGLLAGVSVPALVGISAYVLQLGFPTSAAALTTGKSTLTETLLFQQLTFGNVDHFAVLVVLLLPAAALGAVRPARPADPACDRCSRDLPAARNPASRPQPALARGFDRGARRPRGAADVAARTGRSRMHCRSGGLPDPPVREPPDPGPLQRLRRGRDRHLVTQLTCPGAGAAPAPAPVPAKGSLNRSATFRESAVRTGLRVFKHHAPFGVGTGQYPLYDPVHTAPHSLLVELLAENGILGAAALLAVGWYICAALLRLLRRPRRDGFELELACLLGAGAFLGVAVLGGAALLNGYTDVWPVALAVLLGLSVRFYRERDVAAA